MVLYQVEITHNFGQVRHVCVDITSLINTIMSNAQIVYHAQVNLDRRKDYFFFSYVIFSVLS